MGKVFISYSHKDEGWKNRLTRHLKALEQQKQIVLWDDSMIGTGDDKRGRQKGQRVKR